MANAKQETKALVLEHALDVFSEYGFEGASIRAICRRADVNVAAIHYHWQSKEKLWLAVCGLVAQRMGGLVTEHLDPTAALGDNLGVLLDVLFESLARDPRPVRITAWAGMQADAMDFPLVRKQFSALIRLTVDYLEAQQARGAIGSDVDLEANLSLFYGLVVYQFIDWASQRDYYGVDISDPAHAERIKGATLRAAHLMFGTGTFQE